MIVRCLGLLLLAAAPAAPQSFENPVVRLSSPGRAAVMTGGMIRGGRYELRHATLLDLIGLAWNMPGERVIGGPEWIEKERFDISAQVPRSAEASAIAPMLRTLLEDRFGLKIRQNTKPVSAFALTVAKRNRLRPADGSVPDGCRQKQVSAVVNGSVQRAIVTCGHVTMPEFAAKLRSIGGSYVTHEVVDRTGLEGTWDLTISWTAQQLLGLAGADGVTFSEALSKQTGLELQEQKVPMPVVVVESARMPAGLTRESADRPMRFEVADIKPSEPDAHERTSFQPGGRINLEAVALKTLIDLTWNIHGEDPIDGLPEDVGAQRYTIVAKAPAATQRAASEGGPPMDIDALRTMMRAMLEDRFHLAAHYEERRAPVYVLTADKPKLVRADPDNRSGCGQSYGNAGSGSARVSTFSYTCKNTTMAQLAAMLQEASMADVKHPVIDETGLEGAWDFTLTWTPRVLAPRAAGADPVAGVPLAQAMEKQLGLRMEMEKRPVQTLVIDRIDSKPTAN
ncbi:MAG TPA: TIGR03435 family protein [Bryobacteraceae bacterium]|nr:TIGR03435 family protein [Bryobacteraceae bacterium]